MDEKRIKQLEDLQAEIRKGFGKAFGPLHMTVDQARSKLLEELKEVNHVSEQASMHRIVESVEYGFMFVLSVNEVLGAVNSVVYGEMDLKPFHIRELDLKTVKVIEEVTEQSIDDILTELENFH
jgi:hypothetical protein